jgi:hypothetical protein
MRQQQSKESRTFGDASIILLIQNLKLDNSAFLISERRSWMNSKAMVSSFSRGVITAGDYPYLAAWYVKDFRWVYDPETVT